MISWFLKLCGKTIRYLSATLVLAAMRNRSSFCLLLRLVNTGADAAHWRPGRPTVGIQVSR
jgi:hypothetical protein